MKYADEYIHQPTIGNLNLCRQHSDIIATILKQLYAANKLQGYTVAVIKNNEDAEFNLLEESNYISFTKGMFPFLFIVIQQKQQALKVDIEFINEDYLLMNEGTEK